MTHPLTDLLVGLATLLGVGAVMAFLWWPLGWLGRVGLQLTGRTFSICGDPSYVFPRWLVSLMGLLFVILATLTVVLIACLGGMVAQWFGAAP